MTRNMHITLVLLYLMLGFSHIAFTAGVSVDGGLTREFTMQPGEKNTGSVVIRNSSSTVQQVNISQEDYSFRADGQSLYGNAGSVVRSNCAWMSINPKVLTIPANSSAPVYFTISAPSDKILSGSYWSVLMVEPVAEGSLEPPKDEKGKVTIGINTITRYAIQIVTNIGATGKRSIKILQKQIITDAVGSTLQLDIENTGERWLRPSVRIELYDAKGVLAGRFDGGKLRIYPTCSVRSQVKIGKVAAGKYTALIIIDNGDQSIWGVKYALDIK